MRPIISEGSWSYVGLQWRGALARHPVEGGVVLTIHPSFVHRSAPDHGPARSGAEIQSAPIAAFNISDGVDTVLDGLSIRSKIDATWKQWNQSTCLSARGWLPRQKPPVGRNTALTLRIWHRPQILPRVCAFVLRALCEPRGSF